MTQEKVPANRRAKHDWNEITDQFLASDHADFLTFLKDFGYPHSLHRSPQAKGMSDRKRKVMAAAHEKTRQALMAEPLLARERRKFKVLEELESSGRALLAAVMNNLVPDVELTKRRHGEEVQEWVQRLKNPEVRDNRLPANQIAALSIAAKHADELIRKANGLEDFNWEDAELRQKALAKSEKMQFEIVQTSQGKPLAELPWAPEEKKGTA